jgi:hypothetical protein
VSSSYLHGNDDELGKDAELSGEGGVEARKTLTEPDSTVRRYYLEENREQAECILVCVVKSRTLDYSDEEEAQEDEPQVE